MSHDLLWNILRNPLTKVGLAVVIIIVIWWLTERRHKRSLRKFAASKGYSFEPRLEGADLHLEETSFFQKGDVIKNVVRGVLPDTTFMQVVLRGASFVLFEHETTRREDGDSTQTIVAFEVKPESTFRPPILEAYKPQMERAGNHVFVWKKKSRIPVQHLEQFLQSTLQSFRFASMYDALARG